MRYSSDSDRRNDEATGSRVVHQMPGWVKIFGVVAVLAIAAFAGLHLTGVGMGHFAHGDMAMPLMSPQHQHVP
jgi:hypothetical protein